MNFRSEKHKDYTVTSNKMLIRDADDKEIQR